MFPEVNVILEYFLNNPTQSIHLRELARQTGFSPAGTLKAIRKLVKLSFIKEQHTIATNNYQANTGNLLWKPLKLSYNYYSLFASGLVEALNKKYAEPEAIILFGSYAKGEDNQTSDIDLAIITDEELNFDVTQFEKKLHRKVNILELDKKSLKKEFKNTLANGIVLSGFIQW